MGTQALLFGTLLAASFLFWAQRCAAAESAGSPIVRIAELDGGTNAADMGRVMYALTIAVSIRGSRIQIVRGARRLPINIVNDKGRYRQQRKNGQRLKLFRWRH